jgi:phenylacetate-CoA ligase
LYISSFALNDKNIKKIIAVIKDFKPKAALGYPSSLYTIASWLVENNQELDIPLSFTSSESLLAFQEEKIKLAFNTKMYDWYGNAERTISLYREEGKYYEPFLYSINEYTQSNVITTSLINDYFPLIRYEVNDKIIASEDFNIEKKSFVVNSIEGRVEDYVVLLDGSKIGRLDVVFKGVKNIKFAQIIQEEKFSVIVKIVKGTNFSTRDEAKLINNLVMKLGQDFKVHIQYINKEDLEITSSGKFKLVISKLK